MKPARFCERIIFGKTQCHLYQEGDTCGLPRGCKLSNSQMLHLDREEQLGLRGGDFLGENWAQMSGTEETRRPLNTEIMAQTMAV